MESVCRVGVGVKPSLVRPRPGARSFDSVGGGAGGCLFGGRCVGGVLAASPGASSSVGLSAKGLGGSGRRLLCDSGPGSVPSLSGRARQAGPSVRLPGVLVALVVVVLVGVWFRPSVAWAASTDCESSTTTTSYVDPNAPCDAMYQVYSDAGTLGPGLVAMGGGVVCLFLVGWGVYFVIRVARRGGASS